MKRCPTCNLVETDDALRFCRADGTTLISYSGPLGAEAGTVKFDSGQMSGEIETSILPHASTVPEISRSTGPTTALPAPQLQNTTRELTKPNRRGVVFASIGLAVIVIAVAGYFYLSRNHKTAIESIAVMPFVNESGNANVEYLSDGMTETLISSLSKLPNLNVKPRSSVFRYKGKATDAKTIGNELNVQAILNGRVVQRGQELSLFVELIALNDDPYAKAFLVRAMAKSGRRADALKLVEELKSESATRYVPNYCLAMAYTALGEKEEAFALLEKDIAEHSSFVSVLAVEPALDDLRDDPRFKAMLRRLNLPQ